jgi:hypothetical protein
MDRVRYRGVATLSLLVFSVALAGCDPGPPTGKVGALLEDPSIHILTALCPGERIVDMTAYLLEGNLIDDDDTVIWKVEGTPGTTATDVVLGEVPDGLEERKALVEPLPGNRELIVLVDTSSFRLITPPFTMGELRSDQVLTDEGYVEVSQFRAQRPSRCPE